jgi:sulfur carrier protein ThiS
MFDEDLLDLIAAKLSVEEILDILGWEMHEFVTALKDEILENKAAFEEAVE